MGMFIIEFITRMVNATRMHLQILLETEFITRVDAQHLIDRDTSILERDTILHTFAESVQDALKNVHKIIDNFLQQLFIGVQLTPILKQHIEHHLFFSLYLHFAYLRYIHLLSHHLNNGTYYS